MVKHEITFKITPFPFGGPVSSKFIGERFETRTYFDQTDDRARIRAILDSESICQAYGAQTCRVTEIKKITEENISI